MSNIYPKRMSFTELKAQLEAAGHGNNIPGIIGKDVAMVKDGYKVFRFMLQKGTPYIIEDPRIGIVKAGEASITANLVEQKLCKGTLVFIGSGSIVQANSASDDFDIQIMMLSNERLKPALGLGAPAWCAGDPSFITIPASPADIDRAKQMLNMIWSFINDDEFSDEVLNGLIHSLIHYYNYLKENNDEINLPEISRDRELFNNFIRLVNTYGKRQRAITFYADKMCITPRYLSTVIKKVSGITAKDWVDRAIVTNAKVMLKYGNKQVAQIAYDLNFPNASFFCKYFKRATGITPQEYRKVKS